MGWGAGRIKADTHRRAGRMTPLPIILRTGKSRPVKSGVSMDRFRAESGGLGALAIPGNGSIEIGADQVSQMAEAGEAVDFFHMG